ncbi:hypothetical protein [Rhodococcus sp. ARP2]|uniref:hypothetical protein n=1 Tax=Rhodococcus sp. ARP2 TaxID=1661385 RepID=UPI00064B8232|nr:hypothetical protein [Rhodococcus sp. ARP2]
MSNLDAEGVIFATVENLAAVEGYGHWQQTDMDTFANAKRLGFSTAYIEITTPDDDDDMIHLIAEKLPAQRQLAPEFGAAIDHAYDMTDHKNGI